jgi:ferrous iron transport protein B
MATHVAALAGAPNSGKSSLFNAITGASQKVGNYPGVTVEKKVGSVRLKDGNTLLLVDLPGTYSLDAQSPDEQITLDVLRGVRDIDLKPEVIIAVADATNLEGTLGFVLELKRLGKPVITVLNMADLAHKRGIKIDLKKLEREIGTAVVETTATKKSGIPELLDVVILEQAKLAQGLSNQAADSWVIPTRAEIESRIGEVDRILSRAILKPIEKDLWTARIDSLVLRPILGWFILILSLLLMFQAVFSWAETPMDWIESGLAWLSELVKAKVPNTFVASLLADGAIAGVGAVLVFLPQILILFFFIFLLEATGYMARAAFMMDRMLASVGLQGRSFVPLLSSFACAIPGIMATRTIQSPRDRLITLMVAPLMTCSARLPVYVMLIGAFIPNTQVLGIFTLPGLTMFALFICGIFGAVATAFFLKVTLLKGQTSTFVLELPNYKLPNLRQIVFCVFLRGKIFVKRAGTVILGVSVALWVLSTFPKPPDDWKEPAITYSMVGRIGRVIEPVLRPLGFDWRIATGMVPGFAAREVMVGALATVFAIESASDEAQAVSITEKIRSTWGFPTGAALLAWYVFSPQCLATFAVARRETNGWKWPAIMFTYMLLLAYTFAFVTFQLLTFFKVG